MYTSVLREIPDFLYEHLVYCDNLTHRREMKCCVLLTRNLNFYEFHRKELLHSIDLSRTCLRGITDRLAAYSGPKGKSFKCNEQQIDCTPISAGTTDPAKASISEPSVSQYQERGAISIGKYVCLKFDTTKLFLLVFCWDKLVVLLRPPYKSGTFRIIAEYDQVTHYKIVRAKIKFHTKVKIHFTSGAKELTDFENLTCTHNDRPAEMAIKNENEFRQLQERVRSAKTELHLHRAKTQKEFARMRDTQTFGNNVLRSLQLEEKKPLTRYGDIWLRLTTDDALVIGVPLMNNSAEPNSKILRNIQPLLRVSDTNVRGLECKYRLYQLDQAFQDLETLETYFQSEDATEWTDQSQMHLLPDSFGVLLVKLQIEQAIALSECQLFVLFEVDKQLYGTETTTTFRQQIYLRTIDINQVFEERTAYEITFSATTLHQDFLAMAMTGIETKLLIRFNSSADLKKFEKLLVAKHDFKMVMRGVLFQHISQEYESDMDVDEDYKSERDAKLFYNSKSTSLWYTMLIMRHVISEPITVGELNVILKFYTGSKDRMFLLLKILFHEFLLNRCTIRGIQYPLHHNASIDVNKFETAVCQELRKVLDLQKGEYNAPQMLQHVVTLIQLQMQTDLMAAANR